MEVISIIDVLKQMRYTTEPSEMSLTIASHTISLFYSDNGKIINGKVDRNEIDNCNYTVVHRILEELTENKRYKIKLFNPQSCKWKKIRMNDEKLKLTIDNITADLIVETHLLGYTYLCEALYDISRKHIDGKVVNVERTLKTLAKSRGVKVGAVENTIATAVIRNFYKFYSNLAPENQKQILQEWYSIRIFVRNFSHYLLDCMCI